MHEKVGKSRNTFSNDLEIHVAPVDWHVGSLKQWAQRSAESPGQMRGEKLHAFVACQVRNISEWLGTLWTTFGSHNVEEVHRSATKHTAKSKRRKHTRSRSRLEVELSKKYMPPGAKHISNM